VKNILHNLCTYVEGVLKLTSATDDDDLPLLLLPLDLPLLADAVDTDCTDCSRRSSKSM